MKTTHMKKHNIYLVANYSMRPRNPRMTHVAGYMKNPENIQWDEQVEVSVKLRQKDRNMAKIIINLSTKQVEANRFNDNRDFNELFKYFFKGYHKYITEVMAKIDPVYFNAMLDELQKEVGEEEQEEKNTDETI